jgi:hypothetical protein
MKKSILLLAALFAVLLVNAQSVEDIVKKYTIANKLDKISGYSSIKISGKMSMMNMEMPYEMWMKNPDKLRTVINFSGQENVTVINGTKGYSINPMSGSNEPVEMSLSEVQQNANANLFNNYMESYMKKGQLTFEGSENVGDKPAYKLKSIVDSGTTIYLFIDKTSNQIVKTHISLTKGMVMESDAFMSDYKDNNGIILPMKTTMSMGGMEFSIIYDKVEVNLPMDDSLFKVK